MFDFIQRLILQAGATGMLGYLTGGFLEEVALPFPSPMLFVGASFFVDMQMTFWVILKMFLLIILPTALGSTVGALVIFGLCYSGGRVAINRFSRVLRFTWDDIERIRAKLSTRRSDEWVLFVSRIIPFGPTKIFDIAAGVVRMNPGTFALIIFAGSLIRVSVTLFVALAFGVAVSS